MSEVSFPAIVWETAEPTVLAVVADRGIEDDPDALLALLVYVDGEWRRVHPPEESP